MKLVKCRTSKTLKEIVIMLERLILIILLVIAAALMPGQEAEAAKCARGATYRCVSAGGTRICACWKTGSEICDVDITIPGGVTSCTSGVNCPVLTCSVYGTVDVGDGRCNPKILDPDCGIEGLAFSVNWTTNLLTTTSSQATNNSYQEGWDSYEGRNVSIQGNRPSSMGRNVSTLSKKRSSGRHNSDLGKRHSRSKPKHHPTHPPTPIPTPVPTPIPTPTPPEGEPIILETVITRSTEIKQCAASSCEEAIELDLADCPDCQGPDFEFITFTASEFNSEACICPGGFSTTGECCATAGREIGGGCAEVGQEICIKQLCTTDLTNYEPGMNFPYTCKILQEPPCVEKYFVAPGEIRCRR
ncbi:MAG: hypothetical protein AB7I96_01030 [Candidatus Dadabacteria bacterium]